MLPSRTGSNPAPPLSAILRWAFVALVAMVLPSTALAASSTLTLTDPGGSGFGATISFDDGLDPGNLSIEIDALPTGLGGDLLAFSMRYDVNDYYPDLEAIGSDIGATRAWFSGTVGDRCPCNILANFGGPDLFEATGLAGTQLALVHPTETIVLDTLAGSTFRIFLGFDANDVDAPGKLINGVKVLKLEGEITVVPEPSTAALMLLGLMGLSGNSNRLGKRRD